MWGGEIYQGDPGGAGDGGSCRDGRWKGSRKLSKDDAFGGKKKNKRKTRPEGEPDL